MITKKRNFAMVMFNKKPKTVSEKVKSLLLEIQNTLYDMQIYGFKKQDQNI